MIQSFSNAPYTYSFANGLVVSAELRAVALVENEHHALIL